MKEVSLSDFDKFLQEKTTEAGTQTAGKSLDSFNSSVTKGTDSLDKINNLFQNINNLLSNDFLQNYLLKGGKAQQPPQQQQQQQVVQQREQEADLIEKFINHMPENMTIKDIKKEMKQPHFRDNLKNK
jgi:hypothetical protein